MDTNKKAIEWLFSGDTGSSSKAICAHMLGIKNRDMHSYPSDPSDLGRCLRLLRLIPEWAKRINEMGEYSPGWSGLVEKWEDIAQIMQDEVGIDWEKGRAAPLTYDAMHLAQANGYRMEKYTNKLGKECWKGITADSEFSSEIFHEVPPSIYDLADDCDRNYQYAFHSDLGSLTVLDRLTGFGWRDIETGFRDPDGKFWLASGKLDVRASKCKTVGEAIKWVKDNANTCTGE